MVDFFAILPKDRTFSVSSAAREFEKNANFFSILESQNVKRDMTTINFSGVTTFDISASYNIFYLIAHCDSKNNSDCLVDFYIFKMR